MSGSYESGSARLVRRNLTSLAVSSAPLLLSAWLALAGLMFSTEILWLVALMLAPLGLFSGASAWNSHLNPILSGERVTVANGRLCVDGQLLVAAAEVVQAHVVPREDAVWVQIERKRGAPITLQVESEADGRSLLAALGFDAARARATFRGLPSLVSWPLGKQLLFVTVPVLALLAAAAWLFPGKGVAGSSFMLPLVGALAFVLGLFRGSRVEVGGDGLSVRWWHQRRVIPWSAVRRLARWSAPHDNKPYVGLLVELSDGERVILPAGQEGWSTDNAAQLVERAKAAFEAYQAASRATGVPALSRGGRDALAWVRHLRAMGAGAAADLRQNHISPEALLSVVEDAEQPAVARASAAVALGTGATGEERERVRIVALGTVEPPLRRAIERALDAEADEQALAEALAELEPERTARGRFPS